MCTSKDPICGRYRGFSAVELILGITLSLCVALAIAPLCLSLESLGVREGDQTVRLLEGRVAVGRFERDMRLASAVGSLFALSAPILNASRSQVVFLEHPAVGVMPALVEWEIVNGTLMRRRGVCPANKPLAYPHSLYVDHKTMLEGVQDGGVLVYVADGVAVDPSAVDVDLADIDMVLMKLRVKSKGATDSIGLTAQGRVGR